MFEKVVIVTKETRLDQLVRQFSTKSQAEFYIAQSYIAAAAPRAKSSKELKKEEAKIKADLDEIEVADSIYKTALERIKKIMPQDVKVQHIDWTYLPNFLFSEKDLVVTLGPDGLVINTAKYLNGQPIFAVNPDPDRIDGVLLPFDIESAVKHVPLVLAAEFDVNSITIAKASLNDGQELFGVNDIFIGAKSHVSFRYTINFHGVIEPQSSSGIIVSTGAGSTGWFRSIIEGARHVSQEFDGSKSSAAESRFPWGAEYLYFTVREPFQSKTSSATIGFGKIEKNKHLEITSQMSSGGVIFSDGIENDHLEFNAGKIAVISVADRKAQLIKE